jgi:methylamine dehydrogenase accessory protein MauD
MDVVLVASNVGLWAIVVLEGLAILVLVRQMGMIYRRMPPVGARLDANGPRIGEQVTPMRVTNLLEEQFEIAGPSDRRRLLVFVAPNCEDCQQLAPALRSVFRSDRGATDLTVISIGGDPDENREFLRSAGLADLPFALSPRAGALYGASSTPYALLIEPDGRLAHKGVVNHLEHLESLLEYQAPALATTA